MKFDAQIALVAALKLLDEVGIEKITMRALAASLGVQAPSLYYYYQSRQALLDALAEAIARSAIEGIDRYDTKDDLPKAMANSLRHALLKVRDGARIFSGSYAPTPSVLGFSDRLISALMAQGRDIESAVHTAFNIVYYVVGLAIEEQAFLQKWGGVEHEGNKEIARSNLEAQVADQYPALRNGLTTIIAADFDTRLAQGLHGLLNVKTS